jgi:hypothetical protein
MVGLTWSFEDWTYPSGGTARLWDLKIQIKSMVKI